MGVMKPAETGSAIEAEEARNEGAPMSVTEVETGRRKRAPSRAKRPRSAVTSGRQLFISGDPNSAWSRRYHDLVVGHCNDLGGSDVLSDAQLSLIRRAASIECELERLDAMLSTGAEVNLDAYGRAASHLRRLFETLGIERKAKPVESLAEYLARTGDSAEAQSQ
jgi:hypothetical protein